jgi:primosomal replication protein N
MNMNSVTLAGCVRQAPTIHYREDGIPVLKFTLSIQEENAKLGKTFTLGVPCEVIGPRAEALGEKLAVGETVLVSGKLAYRAAGEGKAGGQLAIYAHQAVRLGAEERV